MANFVLERMKRKGFDGVYQDFSDLPPCAPARKIRRLDAELHPIMEEWCPIGGPVLEHELLKRVMDDTVPDMAPVNEERALVLFKPHHSHFGSSLKVDTELISGLKNPVFWSGCANLVEEDVVGEQQSSSSTNSLAVIPWIPSQFSDPVLEVSTSESGTIEEAMEDGESMEIDGDHGQVVDTGAGAGSFLQWQQHCMFPQHSHLTSTPALGSW
ncbi:uncharacterized protein LOC110023446 [Phalaenopsis equestris]|uniref:uncharacterized protein LOC110023446 n=1 Tax=Phalaenopsis equestris TaxID=78828 RepID=UPI0009E398BD|nr:uncharacterized protein LOC110023446 [Phalaenopsis equestris]XP_020578527.1 uncharacterized protein LOC110023446 [Phalaenopsis equestris]